MSVEVVYVCLCPNCEYVYNSADDTRCTCPKCGYKQVFFSIHTDINISSHISLKGKSKDKIKNRPKFDFKISDEYRYSSSNNVNRYYRIDRENNRYLEIIRDIDTNAVVYKCDEPLKQHINRGSAKNKK